MNVLLWTGVLLLGGCGAVARLLVDDAVGARVGRDLPYGTLLINVSGALVLGLLTGLALAADTALLLGTAAVGSYTTFSAWMSDTLRLEDGRRRGAAVLNIVLSLGLGVAAAALGRAIGTRL